MTFKLKVFGIALHQNIQIILLRNAKQIFKTNFKFN